MSVRVSHPATLAGLAKAITDVQGKARTNIASPIELATRALEGWAKVLVAAQALGVDPLSLSPAGVWYLSDARLPTGTFTVVTLSSYCWNVDRKEPPVTETNGHITLRVKS